MGKERDSLDQSILNLLQADAEQSHALIGEQVGLSGSAVRRRIERLRNEGVIAGVVALLGDGLQASGILVLVTVTFERETPDTYQVFRAAMRKDELVLQCYATSGQFDFVMVVAAADLPSYEAWGERTLMANAAIRRYDSFVVWSTVKYTTQRPLFSKA